MSTQTKPAPQRNGAQPQQPKATQQQPPAEKDPHVVAGKAALESALDRVVEFKPFLSETPIKLSARMVLAYLCTPTRSGKLCTEQQAIRFMMLCKARGLNPWEGDAYIIGYDSDKYGPQFSLVTAHQSYLKRAEVHPEYDGMESGVLVSREGELVELQGDFFNGDDTLVGGWARVHFKNRKVPMYRRLKLATFNQNRSRWEKDPAGMIVKCFDEETEVLTTAGFEKFAAVTGQVLQVTDRGLEPTAEEPFVQQYAGDMVTLDSDDLNFCVTPNHDMVTTGGKIEAGQMYEKSRSRPMFWIPRCVRSGKSQFAMSNDAIIMSAVYLADGSDKPNGKFWVSLSRPAKVKFLEALGGHESRHVHAAAGDAARTAARTITTKTDKQVFGYPFDAIAPLVGRGKIVHTPSLFALSQEQARLFVDTLIQFDGHENKKTGVRRFYSSNPEIVRAFEIAAVIAGYAVSPQTARTSDISTKDNVMMTISERSEIGVRRWGREYHGVGQATGKGRHHPGLTMTPNTSGKVWCVTVPSGVIVVRRRGFSMLCGNCAEADALRSAFPNSYGGMYLEGTDLERQAVDVALSAPAVQPGRGPDSHPEPPAFDRAAATKDLYAMRDDLIGQGALDIVAWDRMLGAFGGAHNAAQLDEEQMQTLARQLGQMLAGPPDREPGDDDPDAGE